MILGALAIGSNGNAQSMTETRGLYLEFINLKKIIGEERSAWEQQKATLADMIQVVQTEINQTEELIEVLESSSTTAEKKRVELRTQLEEAKAASSAFMDEIASYESRMKTLVVRLPEPLQKDLAPLVARLPEDVSATRLSYSQRLQTVVGILAQIDKFNSDLRSVSEVKSLDDGSHEVQTLYFGLATALFSNGQGTYAGYGKPEADGWSWTTVSGDEARAVATALDIYAARKAPVFVSVPMVIE